MKADKLLLHAPNGNACLTFRQGGAFYGFQDHRAYKAIFTPVREPASSPGRTRRAAVTPDPAHAVEKKVEQA